MVTNPRCGDAGALCLPSGGRGWDTEVYVVPRDERRAGCFPPTHLAEVQDEQELLELVPCSNVCGLLPVACLRQLVNTAEASGFRTEQEEEKEVLT